EKICGVVSNWRGLERRTRWKPFRPCGEEGGREAIRNSTLPLPLPAREGGRERPLKQGDRPCVALDCSEQIDRRKPATRPTRKCWPVSVRSWKRSRRPACFWRRMG